MEPMRYCVMASPVGDLLIAGDATGLKVLDFQAGPRPRSPRADWIHSPPSFADVIEQVRAYFAGRLTMFSVRVAPEGTLFQQRVWQALQTIPYGATMSYGELARRIGRPGSARAVGAANGRNPIAIVIPCHRVIGASGALVGYGGGLAIKEALLALERRVMDAAGHDGRKKVGSSRGSGGRGG